MSFKKYLKEAITLNALQPDYNNPLEKNSMVVKYLLIDNNTGNFLNLLIPDKKKALAMVINLNNQDYNSSVGGEYGWKSIEFRVRSDVNKLQQIK